MYLLHKFITILLGAWSAIKGELQHVKGIVQTEPLFHSGQALLNVKEANVIRQWRELGDEGEHTRSQNPYLLFPDVRKEKVF